MSVPTSGEIDALNRRARKVLSVDEQEVLDTAHSEAERALERADLRHLLNTPDGVWGRSHY